jgi:hypothetical protein
MSSEPSIEDLCRPISAKVMPERLKTDRDGSEIRYTRLVGNQRAEAAMALHLIRKRMKQKRKKQ